MRGFPFAVLLLLALGTTSGEHSAPNCMQTVETIDAGVVTLYIVDDGSGLPWIYLETNGHPSVQRGGDAWYDLGTGYEIEQCVDIVIATGEPYPDPDFLVF